MHIQVGCVNKGGASLSQGKSICVHIRKHRLESRWLELAIIYSLCPRNAQNVLKKIKVLFTEEYSHPDVLLVHALQWGLLRLLLAPRW